MVYDLSLFVKLEIREILQRKIDPVSHLLLAKTKDVNLMILGIGMDMIELKRIESIGVERLAGRILTEAEQGWMPQAERRRLEYVAGRFAAKEAVAKAVGTGIGQALGFLDVEISCNEKGAPRVMLSDKSLRILFADRQIRIHLSITHTEQVVSAVAMMEEMFA
jgi:holo-[acyl-carrier protein] synthase